MSAQNLQEDTTVADDAFSFLDLPDEELVNYTPTGPVTKPAAVVVQEAAPAAETVEEEEAPGETEAPAATAGGEAATTEPGEQAAEGDAAHTGEGEAANATKAEDKKTEAEIPKDKPAQEAAAVDYEAAYKQLTAPFKANGKEISVQNVDEAIQLMQMGANYAKKMAALKPNLMLLKMLENNGLLSEEKLSYLIDLDKKVPGAVNKLVKESGLDPMDLDAKQADGYKPTARKVDAREVELDEVLDEIQGTPAFQRTIEVVTKQWDEESRKVVADSPQLLKLINSHIEAGFYDLIAKEVERKTMFGQLNGLSSLQAYKQVGDDINARGGFDHLGRQGKTDTTKPGDEVLPKPQTATKEQLIKEKKRAAAPAKPAPAPASSAPQEEFNPLSLSDEEFMRMSARRY